MGVCCATDNSLALREDYLDRVFFILGSLSGGLSVALGAFAAHGLRRRLTPDLLASIETGARSQMYHALALLRSPGR